MKNESKTYLLNKIKKRNLKLFSFFLLAAFLILVLSKLSKSYTKDVLLDISLTNLDDEIIILNDTVTTNARALISGKGFNLLPYLFSNTKKISINAQNDVYKRNNIMLWDLKNSRYLLERNFGSDVKILNVSPDTVKFNFDVLASKVIPIKLITDITLASGFDIVNTIASDKDSVKILGSKKVIDTITYVRTEALSLENINADFRKTVNIEPLENQIQIIPEAIEISGTVKRFTEGTFKVPVDIINGPKDKTINYFPKYVDLVYYVDIENYKGIKINDFKVACDFSKSSLYSRSLDIEIIKKPSTIKSARLLQNKVEFILSQ